MNCNNCGAAVEPDDRFCPECGAPMPLSPAPEESLFVEPALLEPPEQAAKPAAEPKPEPFVPTWEQAFACVEIDKAQPVREYFRAWDWIPESERSSEVAALAAAYPLKKHRRWGSRFALWALVLAFCAVIFASACGGLWLGAKELRRAYNEFLDELPDSYNIQLPELPETDENEGGSVQDYIEDFFESYYGGESGRYQEFFEQYFGQ